MTLLSTQATLAKKLSNMTEHDVKLAIANHFKQPALPAVADSLTASQQAMLAALPDLARPSRGIAADAELTAAQKAAEAEAKQKADDAEEESKSSKAQLDAFMKSVGDWQKSMDDKLDAMSGKAQDVAEAKPGTVSEETPVGKPDGDTEMADSAFVDGLASLNRHDASRAVTAALSRAQAHADSVYGGFGLRAAPPMMGERIAAYRKRMVGGLQRFSHNFKEVDLAGIKDRPSFEAVESQIYADAAIASRTPEVAEGELIERKRPDGTGRIITEFYGDPKSWMQHFQSPKMIVTAIRTHSN